MTRTTRFSVLLGLGLLTSNLITLYLETPAVAAETNKNPYKMGVEFYQKGEYSKACHYLEHVARLKPKFFPVHYALGNTYMKMGDLDKAKAAYMDCLNNEPDVPTCLNIKKAMDYLNVAAVEKHNKHAAQEAKATAQEQAQISRAEAAAKAEAEAHETKVKLATEQREKILAEGHKQVATIRAKYDEHYRWIDQNTNQHVINRETGEYRTGLDVDTHAELEAQCSEEIKRVMELAEIRARGVQIPSAPTIGTSIHSSNVQSNSNAYVRHYKHQTPSKQTRKIATGSNTTSK